MAARKKSTNKKSRVKNVRKKAVKSVERTRRERRSSSEKTSKAPGVSKGKAAGVSKAKAKAKAVGASKAKAASLPKASPRGRAASTSRSAPGDKKKQADLTERRERMRQDGKTDRTGGAKKTLKHDQTVTAAESKKSAQLAAAGSKPTSAPRAKTQIVGEQTVPKAAKTDPATASGPAAIEASAGATAAARQKTVMKEEAVVSKAAKAPGQRQGFRLNEFVVYPAHGVGQIVAIEEQEVAGFKLELFVISFSKDKMTLRVPTSKVTGVGMRKISDLDTTKRSLDILSGRARIKRTMWSRRAQEYESKINSGDITAIAEVVRDLYRSEAQPEQSYSERQLYEAALDRMVREIAAVQKSNEIDALKAIEAQLQRTHNRQAKAGSAEASDREIEEAA